MKQFHSIEKLDTAILYVLELAASISVLLLAFGLIASMANVLTKGSVLTDHLWMQQIWAWTQCIAIDASSCRNDYPDIPLSRGGRACKGLALWCTFCVAPVHSSDCQ